MNQSNHFIFLNKLLDDTDYSLITQTEINDKITGTIWHWLYDNERGKIVCLFNEVTAISLDCPTADGHLLMKNITVLVLNMVWITLKLTGTGTGTFQTLSGK